MKIEEKLTKMSNRSDEMRIVGGRAIGMLEAMLHHDLIPKVHVPQAREIVDSYNSAKGHYHALQIEAAEIEL